MNLLAESISLDLETCIGEKGDKGGGLHEGRDGYLGTCLGGAEGSSQTEPHWGETALNSLLNFLLGFLTQQVHLCHDVNLWDF